MIDNVLDPLNVNLWELPTVSSRDHLLLPDIAGLYIVYQPVTHTVLYIGQAMSIRQRWLGHTALRKRLRESEARIAWLLWPYESLSHAETLAIAHWRPLWNIKQRNGQHARINTATWPRIVLRLPSSLAAQIRACAHRACRPFRDQVIVFLKRELDRDNSSQ